MTTQADFSEVEDLPINSFQAKSLYEQWASACGTYTDYFPWEYLSTEDQKRWLFFFKSAVTWGGPHFYDRPKPPTDTERFLRGYDGMAHDYMFVFGESSGMTPQDAKKHQIWKDAKIRAVTPRWWQFWRKPGDPGELDYLAYYREIWEQSEEFRQEEARLKKEKEDQRDKHGPDTDAGLYI